jgi:hypothetical protein
MTHTRKVVKTLGNFDVIAFVQATPHFQCFTQAVLGGGQHTSVPERHSEVFQAARYLLVVAMMQLFGYGNCLFPRRGGLFQLFGL